MMAEVNILRNEYESCPDKGCAVCLGIILPRLAECQRSTGETFFSLHIFDKAVHAFKDALHWASVWKEKMNIKVKIAKLTDELNSLESKLRNDFGYPRPEIKSPDYRSSLFDDQSFQNQHQRSQFSQQSSQNQFQSSEFHDRSSYVDNLSFKYQNQAFTKSSSSEFTPLARNNEDEVPKTSLMDLFDETVTQIVIFLLTNYPWFKINDVDNLKLFDQLLADLISKFELSPDLQLNSSKKLNELLIRHFTTCIEVSSELFDDIQFDKALHFLAFTVERMTSKTTEEQLLKNKRFYDQFEILRKNSAMLESKIKGWIAFTLGSDLRKKGSTDKDNCCTLGSEALLHLKKAEAFLFKNRSKYPDIWTQIQCEIGLVHLECFEDKVFARKKFLEAQRFFELFEPSGYIRPAWYSNIILGLERTKPPKKFVLEEILSEIKVKMLLGISALVNFALEKHPPKHSTSYNPRDWMEPVKDLDKKILLKLIKLYHTDKIDRTNFDENYFLVAEEITKYLTAELEKLKNPSQ